MIRAETNAEIRSTKGNSRSGRTPKEVCKLNDANYVKAHLIYVLTLPQRVNDLDKIQRLGLRF